MFLKHEKLTTFPLFIFCYACPKIGNLIINGILRLDIVRKCIFSLINAQLETKHNLYNHHEQNMFSFYVGSLGNFILGD